MKMPVPADKDAAVNDIAEQDSFAAARYPGWGARIVFALALIFILFVQLVGLLEDPPFPFDDPAVRNLIVLFSCGGTGLTVWIWFCFRSNYSRPMRLAVATGTALAIAAIVSVTAALGFKSVLQFSGSLTPQLALPEHDLAVFQTEPSSAVADLKATTPDDFPQFLGPERSGWISKPRLGRDWQSKPPRQLWKRNVGAGWSAFAVVNGFAVTLEQRGSDECVVCYDVQNGEQVWQHATRARHETALGGIGPRSTPTIHQGRVYVLGASGILQCLDGSNGQLIWSDDLRKRYGISASEDEQHVMFGRSASPLIVDQLVIVPGGGLQGRAQNLVAFDRETGQLVWETKNKLPSGDADQIAYSSPTLATLAGHRQILIVNESTASGHDATTGQRLWSHSWPGKSNGSASVSQAVAIGANCVLLSKGYGGGAELLELSASGSGELLVSSVWKVPRSLQTKFNNVVVHNGHAFGLSEGILECVDLENGRRRWKRGRYGHGQILGVGDLLLVLAEEGELHLLELNPERFVHLGSVQALNGKTWNNLCLYGKRLLVRNATEAACFELP
jgi:outer membrane protein assembly factor BamB